MASKRGDYYKILQVDPSAEPEVIIAAYRRLAIKYHPDTNESPDAKARMQLINEAYAVLSDPAGRASYDRTRQAVVAYDFDARPAPDRPPAPNNQPNPSPNPNGYDEAELDRSRAVRAAEEAWRQAMRNADQERDRALHEAEVELTRAKRAAEEAWKRARRDADIQHERAIKEAEEKWNRARRTAQAVQRRP
jgi:curved DNA-binding protein CbpA